VAPCQLAKAHALLRLRSAARPQTTLTPSSSSSAIWTGWFEVRKDGPGRHHYRLFCLLDYEAHDQDKPLLVIIDGRHKPFRTELSSADYAAVRAFGVEYLKRNPRSIN
jgi:hypothetical protein